MSTQEGSAHTGAVVWQGKPWIVPEVVAVTVLVVVLTIVVFWLELSFGLAWTMLFGLPIAVWTGLAFLVLWLVALARYLVLWASNSYVLRKDSLEVRRGIVSLHSSVVMPAGFSDLEVSQTVVGRIVNSGDVVINAQSEKAIKMCKVRAPMAVAAHIRELMGKPIVRLEEHDRA